MKIRAFALLTLLACGSVPLLATAQDAVKENPDHAAMLQSKDPQLAKNKKLVYDFWREVVEGGHLDLMPKYTTESYIQHNPNVPSGRQALTDMFQKSGKKPVTIEARVKSPIVALTAEGDLVTIAFVRELPDPKDASKKYTTTGLTLFRVENGKLAEHWDPAFKN